jgi:PBP1b-binding outer membrane lipoprotein LpoB
MNKIIFAYRKELTTIMKYKSLLLILITAVIMAGCSSGSDKMSEPMTLLNQDKQEVTFPQEKPALFFFITTYT